MAKLVYLLEAYTPSAEAAMLEGTVGRLQAAAGELEQAGQPVRVVGHVLVASDELCLYLVEAKDAETVAELAAKAGLRYERIVQADTALERAAGSPPMEERR